MHATHTLWDTHTHSTTVSVMLTQTVCDVHTYNIFKTTFFFILSTDEISDTNFESRKRVVTARDVRYEQACNRIAVEAVKRGCTDNVTVMLVDITQTSSS